MPRSLARSVSFYYLNRNCFNGIYRVNKSGQFNVPFSDQRISPYLTRGEFQLSADLLGAAVIQNLDFEEFCRKWVKAADFVFLDPPYYNPGERIFNEYVTAEFGDADLGRVASVLRWLDRKGARFLLTFPRTDAAENVGASWQIQEIAVLRTVAGNPLLRRRGREMLISNYVV